MNATNQLNSWVKRLERRLRLGRALRGSAILAFSALVLTVVLVLTTRAFAFSETSIQLARAALFLGLAAVFIPALALPLQRINRRRAASAAETAFPQLQQRLLTFVERDSGPFRDLLAADTLSVTAEAGTSRIVPNAALATSLGAGATCLGILLWMVLFGPGYMGRGAALLWIGQPQAARSVYELRVAPGDTSVRRDADQLVIAQPVGLEPGRVRIFARYSDSTGWQEADMRRQSSSSGFEFLFAALQQPVEYYIQAGPLRSRHYTIRVVDLPTIRNLRVTYHFPAWTGMKDVVEEHGGDLRAVQGTTADIEALTDRPIAGGTVEIENGRAAPLAGGQNNLYKARVPIEKDGSYHIAASDQGQSVRLSDDFFIAAEKPNPPEISITSPGRDYKASPIEEVTLAAKASDDFGLRDMSIHYSVNGGPEQTAGILRQNGAKNADGSTLISLENYKLVPGDLVSVYATAKDGHAESRTDMFFIQTEPFEKQYSQAQQSGGDGGGNQADDQSTITERQKEIISATWNRSRGASAAPADNDSGKFLSDMQSRLGDQARTLATRMKSRQLSRTDPRFNSFVDDMNAAADSMTPAAGKLRQQQWANAMPDEQKALQHLLRAESTFREIQVAFGTSGGGGSGTGDAARDLENLFNLELDTQKNQYETGQTADLSQQRNQQVDEALEKLRDLARRQQELAEQQNQNHQTVQQRWEEEMLRRQEEELRRQLQQMAQNGQQGNPQSGSQGSSSGSSAQTQPQQSGQGNLDPRLQQTIDRLQQANEEMRRAAGNQSGSADATRAADLLREATGILDGVQRAGADQQLGALLNETERLRRQQQEQSEQMKQMIGQPNPGEPGRQARVQTPAQYRDRQRLARQRQQTADDLAHLESQMQQAVHQMASTQRGASSKLRDALGDAQQSEIAEKLRNSVEGIRRGYDRNFNSNETAIDSGMQRLDEGVHAAQQALGEQPPSPEEALNRIEHFRREIESVARAMGRPGSQDKTADKSGPNGANSSDKAAQDKAGLQNKAAQQEQGSQELQRQGAAQPAGQQAGSQQNQSATGQQSTGLGQPAGAPSQRDTAIGEGYQASNPGGPWGGYSGEDEDAYLRPLAPLPEPSNVPPSQAYRDAMRDLDALRRQAKDDPEISRGLQDLAREAQRFNPNHFPGNEKLLEQLETQVLSAAEKIELQLRRKMDESQSGQIRTGTSQPVPPAYRDSVADYYRRLSDKPQP